MKLRLAAALVALAVIGSACSWRDSSSIATVDGVGIDREEFLAEMDAFAERPNLSTILTTQRVLSAPKDGKLDLNFASNRLATWIQTQLVTAELERRGVPVTDDDLAQAEARIAAIFEAAAQQQDTVSFAPEAPAELASMTPEQRNEILRITAVQTILRRELAIEAGIPTDPVALAEADPASFVSTCVSAIVVQTEADAIDVIERVSDGEDFATVADEVNLADMPPGGELPCGAPAIMPEVLGQAVRSAEVGEVAGPFTTDGGSFLILVTSRQDGIDGNDLDLRPILESNWRAATDVPFQQWWGQTAADAMVTVDPKIGVWEPSQFRVRTPDGSTAPAP